MKKVTIDDVAERAGVSKTIASFVLNNVVGRFSEESKAKVLQAVKELDYVPNVNAKNLRSNKSNAIMLVYSKEYLKEPNASTMQFVVEMIKFAEQMEFEINIRTTKNWNSIDEAVDEYVALYNSGRAGGIIFMPAHGEMDEKIFERLFQDYSVNIAVLSTSGGGKKFPTVYMDGYSHMESALDFIVSKGYKEIYYISLKYNDKSHARLKAYSDYLKKGKTKGGFLEYKDFYRNKEELWNLVKPIIYKQQENIAFACWNDVDAINLLELLNIYKVEKKYKIGVMGFDDILLSAHTTPPLTTVHYPFDEAAKNAILIIEKGVGNKESPPSHSVNGYIVERESL